MRKLRGLPALRFEDDHASEDCSRWSDHAMNRVVLIVSILLGRDDVAPKELTHGMPLTFASADVAHRSSPDKVDRWRVVVPPALAAIRMHQGDASTRVDALPWAGQHAANQLDRVILVHWRRRTNLNIESARAIIPCTDQVSYGGRLSCASAWCVFARFRMLHMLARVAPTHPRR